MLVTSQQPHRQYWNEFEQAPKNPVALCRHALTGMAGAGVALRVTPEAV